MIKTKEDFISKIHLIISICIVIPVSFIYGFNPSFSFNISLNTTDEQNFFKAVMGLYMGFSILWVIKLFKNHLLKMTIITNIIFMFGLGSGRIISFIVNGFPSSGFLFGAFAEIFLGCYGLWVLTNKNSIFAKN